MTNFEDLGFVPIEEIQNIFVTELTEIENDLRINGMPQDHRIVFEWFDAIRQRLMSRAKHNMQEYLRKNPVVIEKKKESRDAQQARAGRVENWQEKVAKTRDEAIRQALSG